MTYQDIFTSLAAANGHAGSNNKKRTARNATIKDENIMPGKPSHQHFRAIHPVKWEEGLTVGGGREKKRYN